MKQVTLGEVAHLIGGEPSGEFVPESMVSGTCPIDAYIPGRVSFVRKPAYINFLSDIGKAIVLIPRAMKDVVAEYPRHTYIVVQDVNLAVMKLQTFFYGDALPSRSGIAPSAVIGDRSVLGKGCYVGENVVIGEGVSIGMNAQIMPNCVIMDDVTIGSGSRFYPGVHIYPQTVIGMDCLLHSGVSIGSDGFRFEHDIPNRAIYKMYHAGRVIVGDRVEIGANTTIDRGTFENTATVIHNDAKIDNLVHIGHNITIGARTTVAASSCIGGSTTIGEDVWIGIGVTIANSLHIGDRAKLLLNAVVARDVAPDESVSGFYAMPHEQWVKAYLKLRSGGRG